MSFINPLKGSEVIGKCFSKIKLPQQTLYSSKVNGCLINFSALVPVESIKTLEIAVLVNAKSSVYIYLMKSSLLQTKTVSIEIFAEENKG